MAMTELSAFASTSSWIPVSDFTLVYSRDQLDTVAGPVDIAFDLDVPFDYTGGNLVIMTLKQPRPGQTSYATRHWQVTNLPSTDRILCIAQDGNTTPFDLPNILESFTPWTATAFPNTLISFAPPSVEGSLYGRVTHNTEPLAGVAITVSAVADTNFVDMHLTTDENGEYTTGAIPVGIYSLVASLTGYLNVEIENIIVTIGDSTVCSFEMTPEPEEGDSDLFDLPLVTVLKGNYPNPFNPETNIRFDLAKAAHVTIEVYNIKGQRVTVLANEYRDAGRYNLVWKGKDANGRQVGSGIYFYRMRAGDYQKINKMMLLK
jgi:hypothetical protein